MELIFLEPVLKEMVWGGDRLKTEFHYQIPSDHTGECWAISAHPNGDCRIKSGIDQGKTLSWLWIHKKELFGDWSEQSEFPLLVKIIDAKEDLSIQVHPDDNYARLHENGAMGKTECWYILDCDPDAEIVIGHHAGSHQEMEEMIRMQRWNDFIRKVPVRKGDFFQIEPGCLHAIKGGTLLLETQQNSDITYRVYDYDRRYHGRLRELHIEKSLDVIRAPFEISTSTPIKHRGTDFCCEQLISCEHYTVWRYEVKGTAEFELQTPFLNISVIDGQGDIDGKPVKKGDHLIIPCGYGNYTITGDLTYIASAKEFKG